MVWEGVPWMVREGEHSAEVGRLLAYAATGGNEGVVASGDCKVVASNIPNGNVNIVSGGIVALNRFPGGGQQSYIMRNVGNEVKALDPQGSSGARYDLVAVIVQDPQYVGQPSPPSIANGPYLKTMVYKNVGSTVTTLAQVAPDQTGLALARVKFDASDGTITNADITDLRRLVMPKTDRKVYPAQPTWNLKLLSSSFGPWPAPPFNIEVPTWATDVVITASISSVVHWAPAVQGFFRIRLGTLIGDNIGYDLDNASGAERNTFYLAERFTIDASMRGTLQTLRVEGMRDAGTGHLDSWDGPMMVFDVSFTENAL